MKTYVIPDLHGRLDLLEKALAEIESRVDGGTVVFLGDYVDRGPDSRGVIERLMAGPTKPDWAWHYLRGNHEDMMILADQGAMVRDWLANGGGDTLVSYGHKRGEAVDTSCIDRRHMDWVRELPYLLSDEHRVYVHAAVATGVALEDQDPEFATWSRYGDDNQGIYADPSGRRYFVVHGHTPSATGPHVFDGRLALDTWAVKTGRLVVAVFLDDQPGGPVSFIEILGDEHAAPAAASTSLRPHALSDLLLDPTEMAGLAFLEACGPDEVGVIDNDQKLVAAVVFGRLVGRGLAFNAPGANGPVTHISIKGRHALAAARGERPSV